MSTQLHTDIFAETVRRIADERDEPAWLRETRLDALEALDDLAFPSVIETPGRKWTTLEDLDFDALVDPLSQTEDKDQVGAENARVESFHDALQDDDLADRVEDAFGSVIDPHQNRLTALSTALFTTGTVVYVPAGVDAEDVTIRTSMNSRSLFNYTLVITEDNATATILERQDTGDDVDGERYYSGIVEVDAGENSYVQYGSLQDFDEQTYNYTLKRGHADTYATVNWIEGNIGSRLTKTGVSTELAGDASETKIVGAFFGHDDQHFDLDAKVWHRAEHTTADLVTRGVIDDDARSVYEGVQDVGSDAWDTSSYQRENTLMLSDESEADASPKLIINNHDTEASHSATVGQVDQETLFYMQDRGLTAQQATDMLVAGFFVPVLEEVEVQELREDLETRIAERLD
ncbi:MULTISPECIES: Fe-S cluster assembly protein SufD [Halobacterium]|uniref:Fe-S cluster assembly protein SufD n=1 Tax=Halobacterium TaxID=2239 RepID=UPI0019658A18|nr:MULTISPECIES: Fe-S cluster assembly protein SufD [Halobacterium]MDL0122595.1 Fe-S cluster assembly protein SufD [Halobacterium salinarum]MDL0132790.1 Fe-S cluster assembly protein SufD [Halobacterium salinarum]QRY25196.1 Fe-S cluster assembly protein SufD [Halobacterium sp. BOL4-2]